MFGRKKKQTKPDAVIGLDIGARQIKAAVLQRSGTVIRLGQYVVMPSSGAVARAASADQLGADLQKILEQFEIADCSIRVTMSCATSTICETEVPRMPIEEVRAAFKLPANSMRYLRRDLSGYCLDAAELVDPLKDDPSKKAPTMRILIAAVPKEEILWCRSAFEVAKIKPETLELSAISVVNAFQLGLAAAEDEATLILDIGAQSTSINCIRGDRLLMARMMQFGGDHISEFIGSVLALPAADAESEKIQMSEQVQSFVRQAISPLSREIRSSIDYFERQQECHLGRAFACGGSACSPKLLDFLSEEVGFRIEPWNPVQTLDIEHFNGQTEKLTNVAPSLAGAIGVAAPRIH